MPDTASDQLPPTLEEDEENSRPKRRRDKFQEILDEPKAPLADKWEPVKPHEAANVKPRPVKRGRTCRAPPVSSAKLAQVQGGPSGRRMQFVDVELKVPLEYTRSSFYKRQPIRGTFSD